MTQAPHIRPYQKLIAWQEADKLCLWVYKITESFPKTEIYRLVDQMCRSSSSVPTNIAEGSGKKSKKERARYYETSLCSLEELHYQFVLSRNLGYINDAQFAEADDHIKRTSYLLNRLRSSCFHSETSVPFVPSATSTTSS
jgi:four helix bundle protein